MSRVFTESKIKLFIDYSRKESWDAIYNTIDTNDRYYFFSKRFHFILTLAFLVQKRKLNISRKSNSWITQGIRTSCKNKRVLSFISRHHNESQDFLLYLKKYKSLLRNVIRQAKIMKHGKDILNSNNKPKPMWNIVKNTTKPTRNLVENLVLKDHDREVNDPATVASLFNQYFYRIAAHQDFSHKIQHLIFP